MSDVSETIAIFGGVYSNHLALGAVLEDARRQGATSIYCLGDMGGFGPHPDRVFPLLREYNVLCVQGNYDHSIGNSLEDCACGYTDPRDNHFAQISYDYTLANTSSENRAWLAALPPERRLELASKRVLLAHGSPRQTNEFLWESTSPEHFLGYLLDAAGADVLFVTHTGLHWARELRDGRKVINVGAIGRPANNGDPRVWYCIVRTLGNTPSTLDVEMRAVAYDHATLANEMRAEGLPPEFVETIETGWWTTCLEILPPRERSRGKY